LKGLGIRLAIDDLATGLLVVGLPEQFPVETLKVDRAFVQGLGQDDQDSAIVQSVVALATTLGLTVTEKASRQRHSSPNFAAWVSSAGRVTRMLGQCRQSRSTNCSMETRGCNYQPLAA
jgi:predicted signal transduction protein with EAL and GGDEF domain